MFDKDNFLDLKYTAFAEVLCFYKLLRVLGFKQCEISMVVKPNSTGTESGINVRLDSNGLRYDHDCGVIKLSVVDTLNLWVEFSSFWDNAESDFRVDVIKESSVYKNMESIINRLILDGFTINRHSLRANENKLMN